METVERVICGRCAKIIEPLNGFIIEGNVYVVGDDATLSLGIIGGRPKVNGDSIKYGDLCKSAFHLDCLIEELKIRAGNKKSTTLCTG